MTYNEEIVAKDLIKEIRELRKACGNGESDPETRDRVNISLKKYEEMKAEIAELKRKNEALKEREGAIGLLISKLDIPFEELEINYNDVYVMKDENFMDLSTNYVIKFTARRR